MKDGLLGDTIRRARMDNKMTQEQLAEAINISPTHMKHIESEHRKPSVEVLFLLADVLNFPWMPCSWRHSPPNMRNV